MGKIWDYFVTGGDWTEYRKVRALKEAEKTMKHLRENGEKTELENKKLELEIEKLKEEINHLKKKS